MVTTTAKLNLSAMECSCCMAEWSTQFEVPDDVICGYRKWYARLRRS